MRKAPEEIGNVLAVRVRDEIARSDRLMRRSQIVIEAALYTRDSERLVAHCAWCGRVRVGEVWAVREELPIFLSNALETRRTHGICPDCYEQVQDDAGHGRPVSRTQVVIHTGDPLAAECLTRSLREYPVIERPASRLQVTLPDASSSAVNAVLSRVAGCLSSHALPAVTIDLADRSYTLGEKQLQHD